MAEQEIEIKNEPKKPRKKHYWWRYLLTFIGGFLFAFVSVAGAGAIVGTVMKTSDVVSMFGGNPDEVLGEDYKNTTLLNMAITLSGKKFDNLNDINAVSPLVKKMYEDNIKTVISDNLHFDLDWDTIANASFTSEGDDNITKVLQNELFEGIKIVNFIPESESLGMIYKYFLYDLVRDDHGDPVEDEYGCVTLDLDKPYSLGQYATGASFLNEIMDYIRIGDVIPGADASTNPIIVALRNTTVKNLETRMNSLTVGELFTDEQKAQNPILGDDGIGGYTLSQLGEASTINSIKINTMFTDRESLSSLMKVIYDLNLTVGELKTRDLTQDIKVGDILPDSTSKIIIALSDKTIAQLSDTDTIMSLKLEDILDIPEEDDGTLIWDYKTYTLSQLNTIDVDGNVDLDNMEVWGFFSTDQIENNPLLKSLHTHYPNLKVSQLSDYDVIATLPLGDILGDVSGNVILSALVDKGATIKNLSTVVSSLTVTDVLGEPVGDHSIKDNILIALGDYPVTEIADHFDSLELGEVLYITADSPLVLQSLREVALYDLGNELGELTVGQVIEIEPGSALDKPEIKNAQLSSGTDFIDTLKQHLTLRDIVEIDDLTSPKLLVSLADTTLVNLPDEIEDLTLSDVIELDTDSHPILIALQDTLLFDTGDDGLEYTIENLKFNQVFRASDCQSGFMKLLWDETSGGNFLITDMAGQTSSIVENKTLDALYAAGLLGEVTQADLDKVVPTKGRVGDMTISQFIKNAISLIPSA